MPTPTNTPDVREGGHTPGPWAYRTGMPYDWGWVTDAEGGFIAQAKDPAARDDETLSRHRTAKTDPWAANACLIASAPDLLALARVSAAQFRFYEQQHRAKGTPEADAKAEVNRELAERIEAAISAATGARP